MATCAADVETHLADYVASLRLPARLDDAVRYSLLGGGKRIRPVLAWLSCEATGADPRASLPAGCAIELVHAFSLVHDDLPSIDNDDLRRGRPSLHVHAGEADAVLAGDAMLALAFHLLGRTDDDQLSAALCRELAGATKDMIAGQVIDVAGEPTDVDSLARMHALKTGALITAACRMGGMCGRRSLGLSMDDLAELTTIGARIGLMFQIVDDLLDVEQASDAIGKPAGSDKSAGKRTYPDLIGIPACRAEVERLRSEAHDAIKHLGDTAGGLRLLVDALASRTH